MSETIRSGENFRRERTNVEIDDFYTSILNSYITDAINTFTAVQVLENVGKATDMTVQEIRYGKFDEHDRVVICKGNIVGWKDIFDIAIEEAEITYPDNTSDIAPLEFGAVDLNTGKAILLFEGLHFNHPVDHPNTRDDLGFFEDYGFIYDPNTPTQEVECLTLSRAHPTDESHNRLLILENLADQLISEQQT